MEQQVQRQNGEDHSPPELARPTNKGEHWSAEARATATAYALERMTDGDSLEQACREMNINPGTVWSWINSKPELQLAYDQLKVVRSRGFIERAIDEMQTNPDYKAAESKSRTYMRLAALLNPKEFSDKVHASLGKSGPSGRVSFSLHFNGAQVHNMGALTVVAAQTIGEPIEEVIDEPIDESIDQPYSPLPR